MVACFPDCLHARLLVAVFLVVGCSPPPAARSSSNQGAVTIDSQRSAQGGGGGSIAANFLRDQLDPYLGCTPRSFGACTAYVDCATVGTPPPGDLGATPYASAGAIAVSGLPMTVTLTVMTAMGAFPGQYNSFQQFTPLFSGGEQLLVRAAGGEVPAFTAQLTAPAQPTLSAPAAVEPAHLPRAQDLAFSWSGGSGQLRVAMQGSSQSKKGPMGFQCGFEVADGGGRIPAAALALLAPGSATLAFSVVAAQSLLAGSWQVEVAAETTPLWPDGSAVAVVGLTLE